MSIVTHPAARRRLIRATRWCHDPPVAMMGPALTALIADLVLGEPAESWHPTVSMGQWVSAGRAARRSAAPFASMIEGATIVGGGLVVTVLAAALLDTALDRSAALARGPLRGIVLKPALFVDALASRSDGRRTGTRSRPHRSRACLARTAPRVAAHGLAIGSRGRGRGNRIGGGESQRQRRRAIDGVSRWRPRGRVRLSHAQHRGCHARLSHAGTRMVRQARRTRRRRREPHSLPRHWRPDLRLASAARRVASPRRRVHDARCPPHTEPQRGMAHGGNGGRARRASHKARTYELNDAGREPRPSDIARACRIAALAAGVCPRRRRTVISPRPEVLMTPHAVHGGRLALPRRPAALKN